MGWWQDWKDRAVRKKFKRLGRDCTFVGTNYELKGRVEAGDAVRFGGNLVLRTHKGGHIRLGDAVEIGDYVIIQANAAVEVGEGALIGPYAVLRDTNHLFQGSDAHWRLMPHITEPIHIGKGAYIGAGSYVMPGVTIGDGAVIAPMSVVHRDVPALEVWAGSPASKVAHRMEPDQLSAQRKSQEWARMFGFEVGGATSATEAETAQG